MYVLQIADMHIGAQGSDEKREEVVLKSIVEKVSNQLEANEKVLVCFCGDAIDSKPIDDKELPAEEIEARYNTASRIFEKQFKFDNHELLWGFCPGNHDITHLDYFYGLAKKFDKSYSRSTVHCILIKDESISFVFVNSDFDGDIHRGIIDYSELERALAELRRQDTNQTIALIMHHTIMSMDSKDTSSILNAAELIRIVSKYHITAILHGHTHGKDRYDFGEIGCDIFGVGALISRGYDDVNSQFNLFHYKYGYLTSAVNYSYERDAAGLNNFHETNLLPNIDDHSFTGNTISNIYDKLYKNVKAKKKLYNVRMFGVFELSSFIQDVDENFGRKTEFTTLEYEKNKLIEKSYSYNELAELWEKPEVPKILYFNHGSYFYCKEHNGIDYIIDELKRKQSSGRAVLSTINSKDIFCALSDSDFLPSLMSIQFGIESDILHITMHLRALEAERFLKINICEILYLVKKVNEKIEFRNVDIQILAFRVSITDNFGCFLKAAIDNKENNSKIFNDVFHCNLDVLCKLVNDKISKSETIIKSNGIKLLKEAIETQNNNEDDKKYDKSIIEKLNGAIELYERYGEKRASNSINDTEADSMQQKINDLLKDIVIELQRVKNE